MKLRQGNVFTSVCQEFCPQGGMHGKVACMVKGVCMVGGVHGKGGVHGEGRMYGLVRGHAW